ncbi:MAG: hypothetical protein E6G59_10385 [Actinobacteria bacterium]|nr:MAG: hypothetical protein E6G59_10385 [Actinomycetota bacterium]
MTSRLVRAAVVVSLVALLSACNMTAQITTHLNGKGGGTLGLRVVLDKEVRDGLAGNGGRGINALEGLFNRLRAASWTVTRSEPAGGLELQATKAFTGRQGFTDALRDLSGGSTTGSSGPLGGYSLDYTSHGSFFKTKTDFSGTVDTSEWVSILAAALFKGDRNAAQSKRSGVRRSARASTSRRPRRRSRPRRFCSSACRRCCCLPGSAGTRSGGGRSR